MGPMSGDIEFKGRWWPFSPKKHQLLFKRTRLENLTVTELLTDWNKHRGFNDLGPDSFENTNESDKERVFSHRWLSTEDLADGALQELATEQNPDVELTEESNDSRRHSFDEGNAKDWIETNLSHLTLNEKNIENYLKNDYCFIPKKYSSRCLHLRTSDSEEHTSHSLSEDDIKKFMKKYDFSQKQVLEFEESFLVFDQDKDGVITVDELGTVMAALRQRPSFQELEALIRGVDRDNSGTVDFDEFLELMSKRIHTDPVAELQEVFRVFDANDDGFISADELFEVLTQLDDTITKEEVEGMIKEADTNGDGKVDFSEFQNILHGK